MLAGVKRTFKGEIIGEDSPSGPTSSTSRPSSPKARAAKPDAIFIFYPGGTACSSSRSTRRPA